ncbi:MAG: hypothetical protein QOE92_1956 [Chloroflexota bacterium]|jgi:hypothetical protein|nr:hypothetical protein [Chloroflexota bacterium]
MLYPYVVVASSSVTTSPSASVRATTSPSTSAGSGQLPDTTRSTGNVAYIEAGVGILFILALAGMASVLIRRRFSRL